MTNLVISGEPNANKPYISASWEPVKSVDVGYTVRIERRDKNTTEYSKVREFRTYETSFSQELSADEAKYLYRIKVRTFTFFLTKSEWVISDTVEIKQVSSSPSPPSYVSVSSEGNNVTIRWKAPSNIDYKHNVIYRSSTNDFEQAVKISSVEAQKDSYKSYIDTVDFSAYYWISSVDISGNESDKIFAGSVII